MDQLSLNLNNKDLFIVPRSVFDNKPAYLLKVRGDSMMGLGINDGDLIAVKKTTGEEGQNRASSGDIVVTRLEGSQLENLRLQNYSAAEAPSARDRNIGGTETDVKITATNGNYWLAPRDSAYKPMLLDSGELTIEGLFIGLVRGMTCQ